MKAVYYPASGKMLARIALDGKMACIFKLPPTDEQGHAMAAALKPAEHSADCLCNACTAGIGDSHDKQ